MLPPVWISFDASRFGGVLSFNLGVLSNGMSMVVSIVATPIQMGQLTNLLSINSAVPDASPANNSVSINSLVVGPNLSIERSSHTLVLSWPASVQGFQLEAADDLSVKSWSPASGLPALNGERRVVTNGISGAQLFYRLRKP